MEGRRREMWRMLAELVEPARLESGGMYVPASRNDLMLPMRSREEAEGDRRMMGSGRRPGFLGSETRAGLEAIFAAAVVAAGPARLRFLPMKVSAVLRM